MVYPLVADFSKAKRGQEISKAFIDIECLPGSSKSNVPRDGCAEGSVFRDQMLPKMCVDRSEHPVPEVLASHQAEYDRLQYGEVFSAWFSSAGRDEKYNYDFDGLIRLVRHEKVEETFPSQWDVKRFYLTGCFRDASPNKYEKMSKRILGENVFKYIRHWRICKNLFQKGKVRKEPLTADEIECLLEFEKFKIRKICGMSD